MRQLDMQRYRTMVSDFRLIDPHAPTCRSLNELDSIFVVRKLDQRTYTATIPFPLPE
jgi:hypothetical protein